MNGPRPRPGLPLRAYRRAAAAPRIAHWLDGNEGPAALASELAGATTDPESLRRYPDERLLCAELAARFDLAPEQVVLGAGADELLDRLCRAFLAPGQRLVAPVPCFAMLPHYAALAGAEFVGVPWRRGPLPMAALQAQATTAAMVVATAPNNPTGLSATAAELCALAAASPQTLFAADLAYVEFASDDPTAALLRLPNVVVVRTFSKAYGLAGLRVGYALGPAELVHAVRVCGSPYPCSGPSLALCRQALQRGPDAEALQTIAHGRRELAALLARCGFAVVPSEANFVLAHATDRAIALDFAQQLAAAGIAVRTFDGDDPHLATAVRTTVPGDPQALQNLLHAIAATAPPATARPKGTTS